MKPVTPLQSHYVNCLTQAYKLRPRLQTLPEETLQLFAAETVLAAWPGVEDLSSDDELVRRVLITPNQMTNILSCVIGADPNYEKHTGKNATAQTGTLVAGVCGVAIGHIVGGELVQIEPFSFLSELPIGVSAIIILTLPKILRSRAIIHMQGYRADTGSELFRPAKIRMLKIPQK